MGTNRQHNESGNKGRGSRPANRKRPAARKFTRHWRTLLALVAGISLLQYLNTGAVTWPREFLHKAGDTLGDYATRPQAGWRQATDSLEDLGAARDGKSIPEFDLVGRVVRVADGDTVSVLDTNNSQHKVRLHGIDTPERDQPHGSASRRVLRGLVEGETVGVVVVETDSYGRRVGTLYHQKRNINLALVTAGHAWWYRYYAPHNHQLAAAEQGAREQGLGLWADPHPVPPWDWRRGRR